MKYFFLMNIFITTLVFVTLPDRLIFFLGKLFRKSVKFLRKTFSKQKDDIFYGNSKILSFKDLCNDSLTVCNKQINESMQL